MEKKTGKIQTKKDGGCVRGGEGRSNQPLWMTADMEAPKTYNPSSSTSLSSLFSLSSHLSPYLCEKSEHRIDDQVRQHHVRAGPHSGEEGGKVSEERLPVQETQQGRAGLVRSCVQVVLRGKHACARVRLYSFLPASAAQTS